jgi:hypothetical protein
MQREIKFRAWNQDAQEFQYLVLSGGGHWSHTIEAYSINAIREWQQYTGIKTSIMTRSTRLSGCRSRLALISTVATWTRLKSSATSTKTRNCGTDSIKNHRKVPVVGRIV